MGRSLPREICFHGIPKKLFPLLWLRIKTDSHPDLVKEFLGIIADEFKAVAFSCDGVVFHNGIVKSPGGSDDRDRPIFQAIDLIETAGLIF